MEYTLVLALQGKYRIGHLLTVSTYPRHGISKPHAGNDKKKVSIGTILPLLYSKFMDVSRATYYRGRTFTKGELRIKQF